jgi:hypothetical protein
MQLPPQHGAAAGCWKEKKPIRQLSGLQTGEGGDAEKEVTEDTQDYNDNLNTPCMSFMAALLPQHEQQTTGQSVQACNVNSLPLDEMLKVVVTVVQQIMTEFNGAMLEEATIVAITRIILNLMEQNGH